MIPTFAEIISAFETQEKICANFESGFSARLIAKFTLNFKAKGVVFDLIGHWQQNPVKDALALRILGAFHNYALKNPHSDLGRAYKSRNWDENEIWPECEKLLSENISFFENFIISPPQTNEVGRAAGIFLGANIAAQNWQDEIETFELGASGGLIGNFDSYDYEFGAQKIDNGTKVIINPQIMGAQLPKLRNLKVAQKYSCDLNPQNLYDEEAVMRLESYIWADQIKRFERFANAVEVFRANSKPPEKIDALNFLRQKLPERSEKRLGIIFHTVFLQYPPEEMRAQIHELILQEIKKSKPNAPLFWLRYEPSYALKGFENEKLSGIHHLLNLVGKNYETGEIFAKTLAEVDPHGKHIIWR